MISREDLATVLADDQDLESVTRAVVREHAIRDGMARTGEGREVVADMLDALDSMDQEAVLDLMEGEPTTMRDALQRYMDEIIKRDPDGDELIPAARVFTELAMIMGYPWSGEEALVQLHNPHYGLSLHVVEGDDRELEIRMGDNRWLVASVNWERAGSGGQAAAEEVARAVFRAVLARVIPDRDHHVSLNGAQVADLRAWLARPNGSMSDGGRLSVDALGGGGVIVRTRPYAPQYLPRTEPV